VDLPLALADLVDVDDSMSEALQVFITMKVICECIMFAFIVLVGLSCLCWRN